MYIRQKDTGSITVVVSENAELALQQFPDLFEQVEGEAPENATRLHFKEEAE